MHAIEIAVPCDFPRNEAGLIPFVLFIHAVVLNDLLPKPQSRKHESLKTRNESIDDFFVPSCFRAFVVNAFRIFVYQTVGRIVRVGLLLDSP